MRKNIIILVVGAALLAGCGKSKIELAAEQEAAAKAKAVAEAAAKKAAGPTEEDKKRAVAGLIALVCSSPELVDEVETSIDLFDAFSSEGADKVEAKNHFMKAKNRYRALLEEEMPIRGASYKALMLYADGVTTKKTAADLNTLRDMLKINCRGLYPAQAEKVVVGILFYCAMPTPE